MAAETPDPAYARGMHHALTLAADLLDATPQSIRLAAGEITAQEMRTVRAVLAWKRAEVLGLVGKVEK